LQALARRRVGTEAQQHETAAIEIERRTAVRQPDMRRARPRPGDLRIGGAFKRWRRRAVRPDDRRVIVPITEMIAVHEPLMPHQLGVPLAVCLAGGVAWWSRLEDFRRRLAVARLEHALEILGRGRDIADRHRLALKLISLEQT